MISALIKTMRPRQWTKNGFVFFALMFDKQLFLREPFLRTLEGFLLFCLASSAVYLINDIADVEADRKHPEKKHRPIASGKLPLNAAWLAAIALVAIALPLGYLLSPALAVILAVYLAINILYSRWLKHIPILDVFIVSSGFVLRVAAGVALITVERFSPWLYMITTLFSLYIGFGKRRAEMSLLETGAGSHRKVLDGYTLPLLDQLITIVSGTTIVTYSLYTFTAPNLPENHSMMLTIPFVVYGIFRYLQLIQTGHAAGAPDEVALKDRPLQVTVVLWVISVIAIFYRS
ncbi:MAG TPA: decaprenyl-phosphate phosphoribosyltransferase [Anaerolineales bacterium]|nr:decaprenyl-phosphate phosphoribosyltransferase [Anaerolineales bacterium]HMR99683.1 decaprenyl-phosphate phosphoribosyltransferase [Anaerolineales bacterium]HNQ94764.1 decaprenyl-phosphate phosphoribosyltransferase [Anaerolineales bacterium]HNS61929.1 decaprenyl-phosphate phosphoribosyltransferase [Anaerolineales bacterium]